MGVQIQSLISHRLCNYVYVECWINKESRAFFKGLYTQIASGMVSAHRQNLIETALDSSGIR